MLLLQHKNEEVVKKAPLGNFKFPFCKMFNNKNEMDKSNWSLWSKLNTAEAKLGFHFTWREDWVLCFCFRHNDIGSFGPFYGLALWYSGRSLTLYDKSFPEMKPEKIKLFLLLYVLRIRQSTIQNTELAWKKLRLISCPSIAGFPQKKGFWSRCRIRFHKTHCAIILVSKHTIMLYII